MNLKYIFITLFFFVSFCVANSFGGLGLAIAQNKNGAKIISIIPGTPAEHSELQVGDIIISVNGNSLKNKNIEEMKLKLRGVKNQPVEITYINNTDTLSTIIRRTQLTIKNLELKRIQSEQKDSSLDFKKIETYAGTKERNNQLVAILQNGTPVTKESKIQAKTLDFIYIENDSENKPEWKQNPKNTNNAFAVLKSITRKTIAFETKSEGSVNISILNTDGVVLTKLTKQNVKVGYNSLNWNSISIPGGSYLVTIEQNGRKSGKNILLK